MFSSSSRFAIGTDGHDRVVLEERADRAHRRRDGAIHPRWSGESAHLRAQMGKLAMAAG
jgi:hypothetical protein